MVKLGGSKRNIILNIRNIIVQHPNIALFLFFSIGYFLWRYVGFNFLVWDDTSSVSYNIFSNNSYYSLAKTNYLVNMFKEVFAYVQGDGYRPFMAFAKRIGIGYFAQPSRTILPFVLFNALITGLFSVVYFRLALRFVSSLITAVFIVFLFFFSTPLLTSGLIVYSASQCIIPLLICLALLCYYNFIKKSGKKIFWLIGLFGIMLLGPLFREFVGIVPLLVITLELQRARKLNWLIVTTLLFFLHALFPTALIKWIFFPKLPLVPVFALGNLSDFIQRGTGEGGFLHALASTVKHLHWRVFVDIVSIYPPTLFVLFFVTWWLRIKREGKAAIDNNAVFLLTFFLLSFLPFLKVFNEQVHLLYSLVPMSILLGAAVEKLWFMISASKHSRRLLKAIFTIIIIMVIGDHALNAYAVRKVTQDIYKGVMESANWFVNNVPKGAYVITNAHHLEDIRLYSDGHIEPWGAPGGIPDQRRWMYEPSDLQKMLDECAGRQIYFFDVVIKNPAGQRGAERVLFYVRDRNVEMDDLGILRKTESVYPFLDPLKYLIPLKETTWPGPPDLEFDFYRGPAMSGAPLQREVYAEYHLYRVTGNKVTFSGPPQLLEQNYYGFNIIQYRGRVYAIPQPEGAFELQRVEREGYSRSFQGATIQQVKKAIDKEVKLKTVPAKPITKKTTDNKAKKAIETNYIVEPPPLFLKQNYRGFNLVLYRNHIYAIPQSEGAFDLEKVEKGGYSRAFEGSTVAEVKKAIDAGYVSSYKAGVEEAAGSPPQLLEQNYYGFNIIQYRGRVYAIPQPEGAFELQRVEREGYSRSFQGATIQQVKKAIDKEVKLKTVSTKSTAKKPNELPPKLLEQNYRGFNLVFYRNRVYAIPQAEGTFELKRLKKGGYSRVFEGSNVGMIKKQIDKAVALAKANNEQLFASPPQLLEQNYYGFNIIQYRGRVYAIPQPEGAFELQRVEEGSYSRTFAGKTITEVKKSIDAAFSSSKANDSQAAAKMFPRLFEQDYHGFNIILYRGRVYAILQSEGEFTLEKFKHGGYSKSFEGNSVQEVKKAISKEFNFMTDFKAFWKQKIKAVLKKMGIKK